MLPGGTYRETVTIDKPLTLDGAGQTTIRGSDIWSDWTQSGQTWVSALTVPAFSTANHGVCSANSPNCNASEQVFIDSQPAPFTLDAQRHVILSTDPTHRVVEVSTRERWIDTQSDGVTIQNMSFRHAANAAETGAIGNQSRNNWALKNCKLYYAHGGIVSLGGASGATVTGCDIAYSGCVGINGYLQRQAYVANNSIRWNNSSGFDSQNWGGGGMKFSSFTGLTVENNNIHDNVGPGVWCDIACTTVNIRNNHIHTNAGPGVQYEISTSGSLHSNVVWGVPADVPGLYISSSAHCDVSGNIVRAANRGIQVYDAKRSDAPAGGVQEVSVSNNAIELSTQGIPIFFGGLNTGSQVTASWNLCSLAGADWLSVDHYVS